MKFKNISLIIIFLLPFILLQCKKDKPDEPNNEPTYNPTPYNIKIPKFFPTLLNIPAENPMTVEGIELGRYLFYDGRLCGKVDTFMSCGTCHQQSHAFENGTGYGIGVTGIPTPHVMMSLQNLVFNSSGYLWNGKLYKGNPDFSTPTTYGGNLEDVVWMAIYAAWECHSDTNVCKAMIQKIPMYPPMFKKAFGSDVVTMRNISKAIAQFVRILISSDSKFDRYLRGEVQLTPSELNGLVLFTTEEGADCFHCHGGSGNPLFTTNLFYNNALDTVFNDPRDRYAVTGDFMDKGAYKAPTLRNIEYTGPYMRDGRFLTLEQVIDFYSEGLLQSPYVNPLMHKIKDGGAQLTVSEKADLIAFLKTLSDTSFINNPVFKKPIDLNY